VYPELVVRNKAGQPETVAYHVLPALLLNELQKEHRLNERRSEQVMALQRQLAAQASQLSEVKEMLAALKPQANSAQVAMR
jgi:hypothetical protein